MHTFTGGPRLKPNLKLRPNLIEAEQLKPNAFLYFVRSLECVYEYNNEIDLA